MNAELDGKLPHAAANIITRVELLKKWAPDGAGQTLKDERLLSNARMSWLMSAMMQINAQLPTVLSLPAIQKQLSKIPSHKTSEELSLVLHYTPPDSAEVFSSILVLVLKAKVGPAPFIWFYTATGELTPFRKIELQELREIKQTSFWVFWEMPLLALLTPVGLARTIAGRSVHGTKKP
ncbi:MAG: hypothetical protein Q7R93_00875 [bacterium]|nr:hypothetical protein [bacterium]